jgi:hypothetical protein
VGQEALHFDGCADTVLPLAGNVGVFGVDGQQRMEWKALHSDSVIDVDWAHADRCVSTSEDKTCKVWRPQTGELQAVCFV